MHFKVLATVAAVLFIAWVLYEAYKWGMRKAEQKQLEEEERPY